MTVEDERRRANHSYLLGLLVGGDWKKTHLRLLIWVVLLAGFLLVYRLLAPANGGQIPQPEIAPRSRAPWLWALAAPAVGVAVSVVLLFVLRARARRRTLQALQAPTAQPLVDSLAVQLGSKRLRIAAQPAFLAQAQALAYAFYGEGSAAMSVLNAIRWPEQPPLVRGAGLFAEGCVALLCERELARAAQFFREGRALSTVNPNVPGAAVAEQAYRTALALVELLSGAEAPQARELLEATWKTHRSPQTQLLAAMALAALMERQGNEARAADLRRYIADTAPHCAPLQLRPRDFERTQ